MIYPKPFAQFICLVAILLGGFALAQAQQNPPVVSPSFIEAKVKRGSAYTQTYTISNPTSERVQLSCAVMDYWYDENNNSLLGRPGTLPRSASPWVQFSPAEAIIEAHSSAEIKAIISVPYSAAGGYYTMPVFEVTPLSSSRAIRLRSLLMLATEDASEYQLEVTGGKVSPLTKSEPLELNLDVCNRGIVHTSVRGIFAILDAKGALAARGKIEDDKLLPGQRKMIKEPLVGELQTGSYTAVVTLIYERVGMEPATLVYELPFEVSNAGK